MMIIESQRRDITDALASISPHLPSAEWQNLANNQFLESLTLQYANLFQASGSNLSDVMKSRRNVTVLQPKRNELPG